MSEKKDEKKREWKFWKKEKQKKVLKKREKICEKKETTCKKGGKRF